MFIPKNPFVNPYHRPVSHSAPLLQKIYFGTDNNPNNPDKPEDKPLSPEELNRLIPFLLKMLPGDALTQIQNTVDKIDPDGLITKVSDELKKAGNASLGEENAKSISDAFKGEPKKLQEKVSAFQSQLEGLFKLFQKEKPFDKNSAKTSADQNSSQKPSSEPSPIADVFNQITDATKTLPALFSNLLGAFDQASDSTRKAAADTLKDPTLKKLVDTLSQKGDRFTDLLQRKLTGEKDPLAEALKSLGMDAKTLDQLANTLFKDPEKKESPLPNQAPETKNPKETSVNPNSTSSDASGKQKPPSLLFSGVNPTNPPEEPPEITPESEEALEIMILSQCDLNSPTWKEYFEEYREENPNAESKTLFESYLKLSGIQKYLDKGDSQLVAMLKAAGATPEQTRETLRELKEEGGDLTSLEMVATEFYNVTLKEYLDALKQIAGEDPKVNGSSSTPPKTSSAQKSADTFFTNLDIDAEEVLMALGMSNFDPNSLAWKEFAQEFEQEPKIFFEDCMRFSGVQKYLDEGYNRIVSLLKACKVTPEMAKALLSDPDEVRIGAQSFLATVEEFQNALKQIVNEGDQGGTPPQEGTPPVVPNITEQYPRLRVEILPEEALYALAYTRFDPNHADWNQYAKDCGNMDPKALFDECYRISGIKKYTDQGYSKVMAVFKASGFTPKWAKSILSKVQKKSQLETDPGITEIAEFHGVTPQEIIKILQQLADEGSEPKK